MLVYRSASSMASVSEVEDAYTRYGPALVRKAERYVLAVPRRDDLVTLA
jgi:hypothetical protein